MATIDYHSAAHDFESRKLEEALRTREIPLGSDGGPADLPSMPAREAARTRRLRGDLETFDVYAAVAFLAGVILIGAAAALFA